MPSDTISCVEAFIPGKGAGFGAEDYPEIIWGSPAGGDLHAGSTDVLSLGQGGEIVFGFGTTRIVDGEGADFAVFENPFLIGQGPRIFMEPAEVGVSSDGTSWKDFPCETEYPYAGCAGTVPVAATTLAEAKDPTESGGDLFDLSEVGLDEVRFVRLRDRSKGGASPQAGFDLDAAVVLHARQ